MLIVGLVAAFTFGPCQRCIFRGERCALPVLDSYPARPCSTPGMEGEQPHMSDEKTHYSMWGGFDSNAHLIRFLVTVAIFFMMLTLSCIILFGLLGLSVNTPSVQVSIAGSDKSAGQIKRLSVENNGFLIELESGEKFANFLVPANKLWTNSNIEIAPGDTVKIISSGSANLAEQLSLDISNDPAAYNLRSFNFLVDPLGKPLNGRTTDPREADELRAPLKIRRDAPLGMLLATISPTERTIRENPRAGEVVTLEEAQQGFEHRGPARGMLFLTVNDLLGSANPADREVWMLRRNRAQASATEAEQLENVRRAYLKESASDAEVQTQMQKMLRRWNAIVSNRYFEAFIEDNSGYFMVSVAVSPGKSGK